MSRNRDASTGPLAHPLARLLAHSLAPLTCLLLTHCSLRSRAPLRLLVCSLAHSLTPELMGQWNFFFQFSGYPESMWAGEETKKKVEQRKTRSLGPRDGTRSRMTLLLESRKGNHKTAQISLDTFSFMILSFTDLFCLSLSTSLSLLVCLLFRSETKVV